MEVLESTRFLLLVNMLHSCVGVSDIWKSVTSLRIVVIRVVRWHTYLFLY